MTLWSDPDPENLTGSGSEKKVRIRNTVGTYHILKCGPVLSRSSPAVPSPAPAPSQPTETGRPSRLPNLPQVATTTFLTLPGDVWITCF